MASDQNLNGGIQISETNVRYNQDEEVNDEKQDELYTTQKS